MNTIENIISNIEDARKTNKNPCKNYASKEGAEKATKKIARKAGMYFDTTKQEAHYVVMENKAWGRWVGAVCLSQLQHRKSYIGGYVGWISNEGFNCY